MKTTLLTILLFAAQAAAQLPKLLVIDVDDLGNEFLEDEATPFFSALEHATRVYDRFYTSPVCSPTRASMHYGCRPSHPDLQAPWLTGLSHSPYDTPTDGPLVTLGQALSGAGVSCAKIGKWHMSVPTSLQHPLDHGWDYYHGAMTNVSNYYNYPVNDNGVLVTHVNTYLTEWETDKTIDAINAGFRFISTSFHSIHNPFHIPPAGTFPAGIDTSDDVGKARAMLHNLSSNLWEVVSAAICNEYYVILFSDNGGKQILGGAKGTVLEAGIHTKMWVHGPGVVVGHDSSLIGAYDLYATILQFFGVQRTDQMGPQSESFLYTALGQPGVRNSVYAEAYTLNGVDPAQDSLNWFRTTVGHEYKFLKYYNLDRLSTISSETFNLLGSPLSHQEQTAYDLLVGELASWTL